GRSDHEDVRIFGRALLELAVQRQECVDEIFDLVEKHLRARRIVEGLHLDQQLVDRAAGATGDRTFGTERRESNRRGTFEASALRRERVDLFDETDGPTFLARGGLQGFEVLADLAR